ncbi:MAG: hypothetical protein AAGC92_10645 [Pseudomonadota bacterium]
MRSVVLTDLDDTLFQTARKLPKAVLADARPVAQAHNGAHSYMTAQQAQLMAFLRQGGLVVPVTARGSEAFGRVALDWPGPAIIANGARILTDGQDDPAYAAAMRSALAPHRDALVALPQAARQAALARDMAVRAWAVEEPGLAGVYAVVKANPGTDEARLAELEQPLAAGLPPGWRRHRNGNNLAFLPPPVSKRHAVQWLLARLRQELGPILTIGLGDSLSDLDFMRLCDVWMTPAASQIDTALPTDPWQIGQNR